MKYPKIIVEPQGLSLSEISFITGSIMQNLSEIYKHRGVVHRTFSGKEILIEVKPSGIRA